jgi:hypothetical protein
MRFDPWGRSLLPEVDRSQVIRGLSPIADTDR